MNPYPKRSVPSVFKGIALFTPGGDLVYCIDPGKQGRWHLNLCSTLQESLDLSEPPHFLVPCYTATLDRWLDSATRQVRTFAEAYPLVFRYRALLDAVFETQHINWLMAPLPEEVCKPAMLATYRPRFPQLWESHDLVIRVESRPIKSESAHRSAIAFAQTYTQSYVLRLFVSGYGAATQRILENLHQLLEESIDHPYTLKVIDIFTHPEQAEIDQVSATPTLVKVYPRPVRRIVGDLSDVNRVLRMLGAPGER